MNFDAHGIEYLMKFLSVIVLAGDLVKPLPKQHKKLQIHKIEKIIGQYYTLQHVFLPYLI